MNNKIHSYHSENAVDFRGCEPGTRDKDQVYLPLYHSQSRNKHYVYISHNLLDF